MDGGLTQIGGAGRCQKIGLRQLGSWSKRTARTLYGVLMKDGEARERDVKVESNAKKAREEEV
jgi:hypothetical protein